ncbi:hypothetical protein [Paenibacillus illinoisensis]|uniref:hypothetical protein n=1 Tax=Paenibacillus illinoisensis TaxID=59845 RepID=UPI003015AFEF
MSNITLETRSESYSRMMETVAERHKQCLEGLAQLNGEATANQLAKLLHAQGKTPVFNRNYVHPRLNELVSMKAVEVVGKRKDEDTNRNVAIYKLVI